jgi:ectoine hydroxylase-related dioxygenase (phytanoyl-CoA dioxygenase family)
VPTAAFTDLHDVRLSGMRDETTALDDPAIPALRDYWLRRLQIMRGELRHESDPRRQHLDRVLTDSLGIGQEQIARFFATMPSFEALQRFVLDCLGGAIAPARVAWVNALQDGSAYPPEVQQRHAAVRALAPVLDAADLAHWDAHGYVIVKQAVTPSDCAAAFAAVHAHIGADADDPATWHAAHRRQGIMVQLFQHPALEPARTSLRIHKACAQLWNDEDLVMSTDRVGFNPPEGARFSFPGPHLHWDAVLEPPLGLGVQGILYLADTPAEQGAFTCIPGFQRDIDNWLRALPPGVDPYSRIPAEAAKPIAGKAGDLILWHHALPHGSSPNRGVRPRVVQYLTMYPARWG